jgi:hypothetical protein
MSTLFEIAALRERLAKAEALAARGATPGERAAARAAVERIMQRLRMYGADARSGSSAPPPPPPPRTCEFTYYIRDPWGGRLFLALCEAEGLKPYRRKYQRRSTFLVQVVDNAAGNALFDRFRAIQKHLRRDLQAATEKVIMERVRAKKR